MKKKYLLIIILFAIIIMSKYIFSNYSLKYKINDYSIITNYKNERVYFEISNKDEKYNFDVYSNRKIKKSKITKIDVIEDETFKCIYPIINNLKSYPLCQKDGVFIDYNLIDSELLAKYKKSEVHEDNANKDFIYYDNLANNQYIALWNYRGYFIMNGKNYNNIELFKKDKYDNTLSYLYNDTFYIADYDSEHEYNKLITLNIKTQKKSEIVLPYKIDFDSYFVGSVGKKIYIFDCKYSILYELNIKNNEFKIKCNNETGYVKYNGNEFVSCSKSEYKVNKIKYLQNSDSIYSYKFDNGLYKTINNNQSIKQLINNENINLIKEDKNNIYYSLNNNLYVYNPYKGNNKILYYYELEFNKDNMIYIFFDN